ncbi:mucin-3B isoform X3 [Drosophila montana]
MSRLQNIRMLADTNHNLVGDMSDRSLDEARFNLATHVMSNGVELIIASDKVKSSHVDINHGLTSSSSTSSSSRHVQSLRPVTLAPSTLKNHMILALPTSRQENFTIPTDENQFITKTCLTTYTYHTTYLHKGSTTVESREKVVSNRHTEERNFLRASTQLSLGVTLSNTLELAVGIFPTTYHYYNTLRDNDLVITSSYTVINTVTGPEDYISYLQPSEDATPMLDTNTYYTPLVITKTIQDGSESTKVVTDENILTQVVVTESIPPHGATARLQSIHVASQNKFDSTTSSIDVQIYATKTYLTTLTYLATATQPSSKEVNDHFLSNFQTKVIVNVMTDIVPSSLLGPELLSRFSTELMQKKGKNNRKVLVTLATLISGETLQVTAVNMPKEALTEASPLNIRQSTKLAIKSSTMQNSIRVEKTKDQSEHDSDTETDQTASESENNDIYFRPPKESPTVEQLIGSLNLQRFRPVFDVMAELLQKKIVSRPTQAKPALIYVNERKNQTNNISDEKPVYIPLKPDNPSQTEQSPIRSQSHNSDINSSNNKLDINLSRLAAHSLHINPPEADTELDFPDASVDNVWSNNNNISLNANPLLGYQNLLLNNGIPIRPGEIINANADVIIGRPNGIGGAQFSPPRAKTAINYHAPPFKKKTWLPAPPPPHPPQIPLSLTPPRLIPLVHERSKINRNQQRIIGENYSNILWPPAPVSSISQIYPEFSTTASIYNFQSPTGAHKRLPPNTSNNGIYGSQQVLINLNSELNNNEILEIKQIPQIFSTQLASITTTYPMSDNNYYRQLPPKSSIAPTYSAHHHINLKTDVLSHNVNMNVPPLTFKRENENFPLATAVRGHIPPPPNMPLIKIPLNKAHVEVRLTPQNNRLAVEPPPPEPNIRQTAASTFKQRNQNFSKNIESLSSFSSKTISSTKQPHTSNFYSNSKILPTSPQIFNSAKPANHSNQWNISETRIMWNDPFTSGVSDSDQAATNLIRSEIKKRPTLVGVAPINMLDNYGEDQSARYTSYNSKYNFSNENISPSQSQSLNVNPNLLASKPDISLYSSSSPAHQSTVNPWLSVHTPPYGNQFVRSSSKNIAPAKSTVDPWPSPSQSQSLNVNPNLLASRPDISLYSSSSPAKSTMDPWLSVHTPDGNQSVRLGQPFVKHKPPTQTQSKGKSDIPKKIFVATGERFNLRPIATSQIMENADLYAGKPTKMLPPRLATYLKTTTSMRIYNTQTVVGLQPPPTLSPPPSSPSATRVKEMTTFHRHSTSSTALPTPNVIVAHSFATQFNSGLKVITPSAEMPIIKNSVRLEDSRTNVLRTQSSYIAKTNVPESSASILKSSIKKLSTDSKLIGISPLLVPTSTTYSNKNVQNASSYMTYNNSQSSLHLLESSEAALSTETKILIGEINSNGFKDKITDFLDDASLTKMQSIIFRSIEPVSTKKKIKLTSKTSPTLMDETTKLIQRVTKSRTTDHIQPKSRPYTIMPTTTTATTTMKMRSDISSILVVMTKATGNQNSNSIDLEVPLDYDASISFEIPTRDEDILPPINANSVLLGGILIATPSKTQYTQYTNFNSSASDACNPACKSNKNEICTSITEYVNRCECRLGFARMFPDRPCKPTYTYELQIPITRVGNYLLKFSDEFLNNSSSQYRHLSSIILDAIDRMVMQSDFRDVYYGVQSKEIYSNRDGAVLGCFLLQLSENSNEKRLETVFKKYLRQSNYSIGGTELYTSKEDINMLSIKDFDECVHDDFNDCSTHAHCFNLVGSYTCSCPDGYVDISDNPIYPGRHCADHVIGCDRCNYHGNCVTPILNGTPVCECFAWHAGAMCQLNLKILLISLIAIGTVFIVLLVCVLLIYTRRRVRRGGSTSRHIFITASNYHPSMLTTSSNKSVMSSSAALIRKCGSMEKHVILNDSNSESSHNSGPYSFKDSNLCAADTVEPEQSDRSLTVMIPRAKYYHPTVLPHAQLKKHELTLEKVDNTILFKGTPQFYATHTDAKLKGGTTRDPSEPFGLKESTTHNSGALVSAGFEVSAIVSDRAVQSSSSKTVEWKENQNDQTHQSISRANLEAIFNSGEDIHRMSSWMTNIPPNAISADVRSFDETTVQAVTKSMHLCFDKLAQSTTNEEANTMTERDLGSTFLLPHTHLYKPEKLESDLSGFDSL